MTVATPIVSDRYKTCNEAPARLGPVLVGGASRVREAYPGDVDYASNLDIYESDIYRVLASYVYHPPKGKPGKDPYTGLAWPSRETIAKKCKCSEITVTRKLESLVRKGWLCRPEGDKSGRNHNVKYHLHPDGKPCSLPVAPATQHGVAKKTSTKEDPVNQEPSGEESIGYPKDNRSGSDRLSPESSDRLSPRNDRLSPRTVHIRNNSSELFEKESTIPKPPPPSIQQCGNGGVGGDNNNSHQNSTSKKQEAVEEPEPLDREDRVALRRIEVETGCRVDGTAAVRIKEILRQRGYTLLDLSCAVDKSTLQGANNPTGLLITKAKDIGALVNAVPVRECTFCADEAMYVNPDLPLDPEIPIRDQEVWHYCNECSAGPELKRKDELREKHICPTCEGRKNTAEGKPCTDCHGTGGCWSEQELRELNKCYVCWGTGKVSTGDKCWRCAGTGKDQK